MKKMEKKVISITLVMIMLVSVLIPSISSAATGEVTINDRKLKEAIAEQVDVNNDGIITEEEMKNLTGIAIPEGVADLTGLEYAVDLHSIRMQYNKIMPDLSVLRSSGLMMLIEIKDVPEGHLAKLDFLKTINDTISDLSLTILNTTNENDIEIGCESLKEVKNLTGLSLERVHPTDMKSIYECSNLAGLDLVNLNVDLNGIGNLKKLDYLCISDVDMFNFSEVGKLDNLGWLYILNSSVEDDSYLNFSMNSKDLGEVTIANTNISDLSFLKNSNIYELTVADSPVKDLRVISTLKGLQELNIDIDGVKINSVEEYKNMYEKSEENKNETKEETTSQEKTPTETKTDPKTETKKQAEKPTVIPQAGINVVGSAISILVAISVAILAVVFIKAERK